MGTKMTRRRAVRPWTTLVVPAKISSGRRRHSVPKGMRQMYCWSLLPIVVSSLSCFVVCFTSFAVPVTGCPLMGLLDSAAHRAIFVKTSTQLTQLWWRTMRFSCVCVCVCACVH